MGWASAANVSPFRSGPRISTLPQEAADAFAPDGLSQVETG
jgi:hypothetical protein